MTGRIVGVDVARCLALVGMMATHIVPGVVDGEVPLLFQAAAGRSSALFAVLAGVSLVLVGGRAPLRGRAWSGLAAGTAVRAAAIGLLGLALGELDTGIAVILCSYALFFLVTLPFLALRTRWLVAVVVVWVPLAPVISLLVRRRLPVTTYDVPSFSVLGDAPGAVLRELLVTGYYPVLTWVPYLLVGVVIGRLDLRSPRVAALLAVVGGVAVLVSVAVADVLLHRPGARSALVSTYDVAGWRGDLDTTLAHGLYGVTPTGSSWWLAVRAPHSGTAPDLLMTLGSAALVLALCLLLGQALPRAGSVLLGAGALTLSLYTLHVVLRSSDLWDSDGLATWVGQVALVLGIGAAFRWGGHRGPLEVLVGEMSAAARRRVGGVAPVGRTPSVGSGT